MEQKQKTNLIIIILLIFLLIASLLIVVRFIIGKNILSESQQKINAILQQLQEEQQLKLATPVFKSSDPTTGNLQAANTIFIFSNFNCPHCQRQAAILDELTKKYPQEIFLIWKDIISPLDNLAKNAALAARCAQSQNYFWQYHDYLFTNQDKLAEDGIWQTIASQLNLDLNKFNQCLANKEPLLLIESDVAEATALNIFSSPYLFVNGEPIDSLITLEELEKKLILR